MKKVLVFGALLAVLVAAPSLAYGATFRGSQSYYLNSGETVSGNLYAAGSDISIVGAVIGDLFAAGGNIFLSGPVGADLAAAGGTLNIIGGNVAGDVRVAGGTVTIVNATGGEMLVAGGQVSIMSGATIAKDVKIAGGNVNFSGSTDGGLVIRGDQVYINGEVEHDLSVKARDVKIGPKAVIKGNFDYSAPNEAVIETGAKISGVTSFHKVDVSSGKEAKAVTAFFGFITLVMIAKAGMLIIASLVALYLGRGHVKSILKTASSNFFREMGRGFVVLFIVPIAIIISFVTVVGIPLGAIALLFYLAFVGIAAVTGGLLFAQLAIRYVFKKENYELNWWVVILSVLALGIIGMIPVIGWIINAAIVLATLGAWTKYVYAGVK